ncbi:hypothetical protein C4J87_0805 [Pseudomonas sp. R1-43-08]|nr:hypothetical protein [Pseudomonas sp. R1-43-08]AZF40980.1 hypothetical protein C4J87_0805 [Pseudomonas sp. R1-43-08]
MNIAATLVPTPTSFPTPPTNNRQQRGIDDSHTMQKRALEERVDPPPAKNSLGLHPVPAPTPEHELDTSKTVIYGSVNVIPPTANYTRHEREQRIQAYADRVATQIKHIESGSDGERNTKFQHTRPFLEPAGYFSGGLLAAGYDPHEKVTVTFYSYVGMGTPQEETNRDVRTYFAWEIAAGAFAHDKVPRGGPLNFQGMQISAQDKNKIDELEVLGSHLQDHWEHDVAAPLRDASGALAKRSGEADAYVLQGTLQSLRNDKHSYERLSPAAQAAITRTLEIRGNAVIPNLYGYPLAGYAFIPYINYHGDYDHRPNKGLMIDLKNGTVSEIDGDDNFANWAKHNHAQLLNRFNARDRQGGHDAHWVSAGYVLTALILDKHSTFPGRKGPLSDKAVPVRELFNYAQSRDSDYYLKFGDLKNGIAPHYQAMNAKNALWADQTEVFGASQQHWKEAKEFWGNTFGYLPIVGNAGNIVFGVHDGLYGQTAEDRVGGNAAAVISGLQLAHELAPIGVHGAEEPPVNFSNGAYYRWQSDEQTHQLELVRVRQASTQTDPVDVGLTPSPDNGIPPTPTLTDEKIATLRQLISRQGSPSIDELFSDKNNFSTLDGKISQLKEIDEQLYTFVDSTKLGKDTRLNILVHGLSDPTTGIAKVIYDGKLNTPQDLLDTLRFQGINPEDYEKIRLLSCGSADGGTASFAAEFQRLIDRPVKGYKGTVTVGVTPEAIKRFTDRIENHYVHQAKQKDITMTDSLRNDIRLLAERDVNEDVMKHFRTLKKNPYWNPWKWWTFEYNPVRFDQRSASR